MEKNLERYPLTQQGAEYIHVHYSQVHQLFPLHVHNYYEVEYVISGVGTQRINGELLPIQKGSAWILGIGDDHLVEGSDLLIANLSLYPPLLPEKMAEEMKALPLPLFGTVCRAQQQLVEVSFEKLVENMQGCELGKLRTTQALCQLILAVIIENMSANFRTAGKTAQDAMCGRR